MSLVDRTKELLESRLADGFSLRSIAVKDGEPNYEWLKKFSAGKIANPGADRVESLLGRLMQLGDCDSGVS